MTAIEEFILDKMSSYIVGGSSPETAARFTRGELAAIYKGDHRSRDASGAWRVTPPPEALSPGAAMAKCDEALTEIVNYYAGKERQGTAPETAPAAQDKSGFEKMAEYAGRKTA